jgi:hypothetical protein
MVSLRRKEYSMRHGTGIGFCSRIPRRMYVALLAATVSLGLAATVRERSANRWVRAYSRTVI